MGKERKKPGKMSFWIVLLVFCIVVSVFCVVKKHDLMQSREIVSDKSMEEKLENLEIWDSYSIQNESEDRKDIPDMPSGIVEE